MNRFQRQDAGKHANLHVIELTTGQVILWMCLLLVSLTIAFALGIIVARLDTSFDDALRAEAEPRPVETEIYTMPVFEQDTGASATDDGAPDTNGQTPQRTPEVPRPRSPYMDVTPRMTSLEPLPTQRPAPLQVEAPSRAPLDDASDTPPEEEEEEELDAPELTPAPAPEPEPVPVPEAPPAEPAATSPEPVSPPLLTPITPDEPPLEPLTAAAVDGGPAPQTSPGASGGFCVQLIAISGADRDARAAALQEKLRTESGIQTEIVTTRDGLHHRLVVTGFESKDSAANALSELREKSGFNDAFVRAL